MNVEKLKPKYDFSTLLSTPLVSDSEGSFLSLPTYSTKIASAVRSGQPSTLRRGVKRQSLQNSTFTPHTGSHSYVPGSAALSTVTPGTPALQSAVIVAVVEGRGHARGEIGMASIDLKNPEMILSQFPDSQTYVKVMTKLEVLNPIEIVMPNTACEGGTATKLFSMISNYCPHVNLATVQRKYFNESKGVQMVHQLVVPEYNSVELEVVSKYYCLAAASALLKYIEFIQNIVYASNSLKIVFRGSEQTTMIDCFLLLSLRDCTLLLTDLSTVKNLELISNARDPKSCHCLFGILNYTKTQQGARLLRSNILQPPCSLETIKLRQQCIQEFIDNEEMFYGLQSVLKRFLDIDHLISLLVQLPKNETVKSAENKISLVIYLKHCLELVEPLRAAISGSQNPLLSTFHEMLNDKRFGDVLVKIQEIIHEDAHYQKGALNMRAQKCFAVKPNLNGYLDVARRTYSETIDDIVEMVSQLGEKEGLAVKTSYNNSRGFFIQIYSGSGTDGKVQPVAVEDLPPVFIKAIKSKNTISCTTADLIKMNDRCRESLNEIYLMTNVVISELLEVLRTNIGCFYKLSECVAMLDLLLSLAHTCTVSNYVCPEFTDTLAIKQGYHPILEKIKFEPPVPNNTYASGESNFIIITGPNMSGKSTYLKQVALLQILAQIGCFVPARYASFRLTHQIFSRIGSDNDIETNASTFMVEMREINYIIQNIKDDSLVVIDELGRGTSSEEGVGLCHAICEQLIASKAFTFFATHFLELTQLESLYPNVENYHFEIKSLPTRESNQKLPGLNFTHQLVKGETEERHYGLRLAAMSSLPQSIIEEAGTLALEIQLQKTASQNETSDATRLRAVFKLGTRLIQVARNSQLDEVSLRVFLQHLKEEYLQQLSTEIGTNEE